MRAPFVLSLAAWLVAGAAAGCSSRQQPFRPMPITAIVFLKLECSLGSVRFVPLVDANTVELSCPPKPTLHRVAVSVGDYRLAFRDSNEDRTWDQWTFHARRAGGSYYWGDISIVPGLARVVAAPGTHQQLERDTGVMLEFAVTEKP